MAMNAERHPRYRMRIACESYQTPERIKKRKPELAPVNQTLLQHSLHPEHVEVDWRADELEVRRGLTSELDEMWSYV